MPLAGILGLGAPELVVILIILGIPTAIAAVVVVIFLINRKKQEIPPRVGADLYTELKKLEELRTQRLLTDAEFEAQKAKLLARTS